MLRAARGSLAIVLLAGTLAGCGGGVSIGLGEDDEDFFFFRPRTSGRAGSVTVSRAAPDPRLDGVFSARDVLLSEPARFRAVGDYPETCRFRFDNLQQESGQVAGMAGEIRYLPDSTTVRDVVLSVAGQEFRHEGSGAAVDRAANQVVFDGQAFTSTQRTGQTFVLAGAIPIRTDFRDAGC
jgi:hypothetical protein